MVEEWVQKNVLKCQQQKKKKKREREEKLKIISTNKYARRLAVIKKTDIQSAHRCQTLSALKVKIF